MITVLKALTTKGFAGSAIVAGWEGLGRSVTSVTVAEVPDAIDWLRGGEVVLSTAFFMKERPDWFETWVEGMVQAGAAALAIKPQRFIESIPDRIRETADRLRFPLISLPLTVTWPMIITPLTEEIIRSRQVSPNGNSDDWQNELLQAIVDGLGFPTVAELLCGRLGLPVAIHNEYLDVAAIKAPGGSEEKYGLLLEERQSSSVVGLLKGQLNSRHPEETARTPLIWNLRGVEVREHFHRLVNHDRTVGYLSILRLGDDPEPDEVLSDYSASVVSLAFVRLQAAVEEAQFRMRYVLRSFLRSQGAAPGIHEDLEPTLKQVGAFLLLRPGTNAEGAQLTPLTGTGDALVRLEALIHSSDPLSAMTELPEGIAVLIHVPKGQNPANYLKTVAGEISKRATELLGAPVAVGIGRTASTPDEYRMSFVQAKRAVSVAVTGALQDQICSFDEIGIYRLLDRLQDSGVLKEYKDEVLGRLELADRESGLGLLATLEAYFDADCKTAKVAKMLYLHENTVRYRLQQIQRITGLNLSRVDDLARLYIAVKISQLGV